MVGLPRVPQREDCEGHRVMTSAHDEVHRRTIVVVMGQCVQRLATDVGHCETMTKVIAG